MTEAYKLDSNSNLGRPVIKFTLLGVAFGLCFPILATIIEWPRQPGLGLLDLHLQTPLLAIIDTAPFFLGLFSFLLGRQTEKNLNASHHHAQTIKEHSAHLEVRNKELTELNEVLDGLVYTASHDLKTPLVNLTSMLNMLTAMLKRPGSEAMVEEIIGRMHKATEKFRVTIHDLLDVSRVERQFQEEVQTLTLDETASEVLDSLKAEIQERHAKIDLDFTAAPEVTFSKSGLESILQNLLSNALKYAHPERTPEINLSSKLNGQFVQLAVQDNGLGIDLAKQEGKLFKMFTRLHGNQSEGSGIGLYIVKRTIEQAGGSIEVRSTPNKGSTFLVNIPT